MNVDIFWGVVVCGHVCVRTCVGLLYIPVYLFQVPRTVCGTQKSLNKYLQEKMNN